MTRLALPPLPLSPDSDYDRRLQWYLQQVMGVEVPRAFDEVTRVTDLIAVALGTTGAAERVTFNVPVVTVSQILELSRAGANALTARLTRGSDANFQVWVSNGAGNAAGDPQADLMMVYEGVSATVCGLRFHRGLGPTDGHLALWAGNGERMRVKATGAVRLVPFAGSPSGLEDGDVWYDAAAGKFRGRAAGVTVDFH